MPRSATISLWVGTRKGAFCFKSTNRKTWDAAGPFLSGEEVQHLAQDPRDPKRFYAAAGNSWFGPHLYASSNNGKTWKLSENGLALKELAGATLKRFWNITPGAPDELGVIYMGPIPACSIAALTMAQAGNSFPASASIPRAKNGLLARAA